MTTQTTNLDPKKAAPANANVQWDGFSGDWMTKITRNSTAIAEEMIMKATAEYLEIIDSQSKQQQNFIKELTAYTEANAREIRRSGWMQMWGEVAQGGSQIAGAMAQMATINSSSAKEDDLSTDIQNINKQVKPLNQMKSFIDESPLNRQTLVTEEDPVEPSAVVTNRIAQLEREDFLAKRGNDYNMDENSTKAAINYMKGPVYENDNPEGYAEFREKLNSELDRKNEELNTLEMRNRSIMTTKEAKAKTFEALLTASGTVAHGATVVSKSDADAQAAIYSALVQQANMGESSTGKQMDAAAQQAMSELQILQKIQDAQRV